MKPVLRESLVRKARKETKALRDLWAKPEPKGSRESRGRLVCRVFRAIPDHRDSPVRRAKRETEALKVLRVRLDRKVRRESRAYPEIWHWRT